MKTFKITAHNAPAFCRHLTTLNSLSADPNGGPYRFDLYQQLKRLENKANRICTAYCNGDGDEAKQDKQLEAIKTKVLQLLPNLPADTFFINRDPRGYSLKVREGKAKELDLYRDWGSYGILAPEF